MGNTKLMLTFVTFNFTRIMASLKERTASGLLWGAMNNGLMQLLNIVFGIFLARMLSPDDYGLVGMIAIFTALAATLQESGFTSALVNKKEVTDNDYNSVFWFSTLMSVALFILLFAGAPLIALYFGQPELVRLSRLAFVCIPLAALGVVPQAYLFKNLKVKEATVVRCSGLLISGLVGIVLAFRGMAYWSLVWQQLCYVGITSLGKYALIPWRPSLKVDFGPVRSMFGFSCKIMLTSIVTTINQNILTVIFGSMFTKRVVGNFTQAFKWNNMTSSLVSGTIAQVAQPVFSSIQDDSERLVHVVRKMIRFTAFLAFPVMLGLCIIAREFILITIGSKWIGSIVLLQILCVSGAFIPLQQTYQNLIVSRNRSDLFMWITVFQVALQIVVVLVLGHYGIAMMVTGYSLFNILWLLVWHGYTHRLIPLRLTDALRDILPFLLASLVAMAVACLAAWSLEGIWLKMLVKIAVAAVSYFVMMKVTHAKIMEECIAYVFKRKKN